jgi:hypothetical protein
MDNNLPNEWGYLDGAAEVTDTHTLGVYHAHNQNGRVTLIDRTTGYRMTFDSLASIDHNRFKIKIPSE